MIDRAATRAAPSANTPAFGAGTDEAAAGNAIAVLPVVNMSKDAEDEYSSDGISEQILNSLAQIPDLRPGAQGHVGR